MTTIVINEHSDEGRMLMNMIRAAKRSSDAVVSIEGDDSERIPGLQCTKEERIASVRRGEEDYAAGRFVTSDKLRTKYPRI